MAEPITVGVTMGMKVAIGKGEDAWLSLKLEGVPANATEQEITEALDTQKLVYSQVKSRLLASLTQARQERM